MSQVRTMGYVMAGGMEHFRMASHVQVNQAQSAYDEPSAACSARREAVKQSAHVPSVSLRSAGLIVGICLMALGMIFLMNAAKKAELSKQIANMNASIAQTVKDNYELNIQVVTARDSTRICYKAVQELGMISSEGAETYYVTAPETRASATTAPSLPGGQTASSGSH